MRIQSSDVSLASAHLAVERRSRRESLTAWAGERPAARTGLPGDRVTLSTPAPPPPRAAETEAAEETELEGEQGVDPRLRVIMLLLERLTGRRIRILELESLDREKVDAIAQQQSQEARSQRAGWGLEYEYHEVHEELERTSFSAEGVVRTADGRELGFTLGVELMRVERSEAHVSLRLGDAVKKDPLVVNFGSSAAELTDFAFSFDLDADGATERIASVAPGSGYLVLDRNGDGRATNGAELFGPATGEGFGELAAYDTDANGWIDEADPVFTQLRLWTPDEEGRGALIGLAEAGVGAIQLGRVATPFEIDGGELRSTGVFLHEDGRAGTVQQVDLFV
jgi:hypothetical protein